MRRRRPAFRLLRTPVLVASERCDRPKGQTPGEFANSLTEASDQSLGRCAEVFCSVFIQTSISADKLSHMRGYLKEESNQKLVIDKNGQVRGNKGLPSKPILHPKFLRAEPFTSQSISSNKSDYQKLQKRFRIQQWPIFYDWEPSHRETFAESRQIPLDEVDAKMTRWFMGQKASPYENLPRDLVATGIAVISFHPTITLLKLQDWSSTEPVIDIQRMTNKICLGLSESLQQCLPSEISLQQWHSLPLPRARELLFDFRRGRPRTEEGDWLTRAIVATRAPAGKHRQALIEEYPDVSPSTVENWISRMKPKSTHTDPLDEPLLRVTGPRTRPSVTLSEYAVNRIKELGL